VLWKPSWRSEGCALRSVFWHPVRCSAATAGTASASTWLIHMDLRSFWCARCFGLFVSSSSRYLPQNVGQVSPFCRPWTVRVRNNNLIVVIFEVKHQCICCTVVAPHLNRRDLVRLFNENRAVHPEPATCSYQGVLTNPSGWPQQRVQPFCKRSGNLASFSGKGPLGILYPSSLTISFVGADVLVNLLKVFPSV
jgi:hypothetical protein